MGLPRVLKHYNCYGNGQNWLGQTEAITLPELARKMEEYRGGGMPGSVDVDLGQEKLEMEIKAGGLMRDALRDYGAATVDAVPLRWMGSYQRDDTGDIDAVEISVRGRYSMMSMGEAKAGEKGEHTLKLSLSYYRLEINGSVAIEIDMLNFILIVDGRDMLAEHRRIIRA